MVLVRTSASTSTGEVEPQPIDWYRVIVQQAPHPVPVNAPRAGAPSTEAEEARLIALVVAGDREALATLYDLHAGRLAALISRILGDAVQAEDVVHDVFVEAWHHAHDFDPARGTVRAWLTTRARSRALDKIGHRERGARVSALVSEQAPRTSAGERELEGRHDAGILHKSLGHLPPELVDLIEGAYFEGLSATTLAERFSIPVGTVKSRLARAIALLREKLAPAAPAEGGDA
jgi:RNA polymerase sigma-70 factor, ECF subfamily